MLLAVLLAPEIVLQAQERASIFQSDEMWVTCAAAAVGGDAIFCSASLGGCGRHVLRLDADGNVLWYKNFLSGFPPDCHRPKICGHFPDGDSYVVGYGPQSQELEIMRLGPDGDLIWAKWYLALDGSLSELIRASVKCTPGGDLVVQLGFIDQRFIVARVAASGGLIWARLFSVNVPEPYGNGWYVTDADDGSIQTVQSLIRANGQDVDIFRMTDLASDGTVEWSRTYQCPGRPAVHDVKRAANGSWTVAGLIDGVVFMAGLDSSGIVQWARTYPQLASVIGVGLHTLPGDEILISCRPQNVGYSLLRTTATGIPIERIRYDHPFSSPTDRTFVGTSGPQVRMVGALVYFPPGWTSTYHEHDFLFSLDSLPDCTFATDAIGHVDIMITSSDSEVLSIPIALSQEDLAMSTSDMSTQYLGEVCDFATGVGGQAAPDTEMFIYPSPNNGLWWADIPQRSRGMEKLLFSAYDTFGRLVSQSVLAAASPVRIDMRGVAPGLYMVDFHDGTARYRGYTMVE